MTEAMGSGARAGSCRRSQPLSPAGREPSIRTLRSWTKLRRIPYHMVGHFVLFDVREVSLHFRTKLNVPARG
jgi:hypothetical protein